MSPDELARLAHANDLAHRAGIVTHPVTPEYLNVTRLNDLATAHRRTPALPAVGLPPVTAAAVGVSSPSVGRRLDVRATPRTGRDAGGRHDDG
jgi:hypothetical protein